MSIQIQFRRGTTAEHSTFTGAVGEITVDTTKDTAVVHDNSQVGGFALLREDGSNCALSDGSASTPAIKFSSSTTTGIYSPGSNQLALSTNGTGRLFVDSSGNVAVGTPSAVDSSGYGTAVDIRGSSTGNGAVIYLRNSDGTVTGQLAAYGDGRMDIGTTTNHPLKFFTNNSEKVRITSTGALNFVGAGTAGSTQAVSFNGSAPVNSLVIDSTGKVGLGTSAPTYLLELGSASYSGANQFIARNDASNDLRLGIAAATKTTRWLGCDVSADNFFIGRDSSVSDLVIDSSGRVGVGTTSPGTYNANLAVYSAGGAFVGALHANASGTFPKVSAISLGSDAVSYTYTTNGTTVALTGSAHIAALQSASPGAATELAFLTTIGGGVNERARIDSSGRLLVGTPSARSNFFNSTFSPRFQLEGPSDTARIASIVSNNVSGAGGVLVLASEKSGAAGGNTVVSDNGQLGLVSFQGNDGSEFVEAVRIEAQVDGTPGANDMPGRLVFSTCPSGSASPVERMRINSAGTFGILVPTGSDALYISSSDTAGTTYPLILGRSSATSMYTGTTQFRVWNNGNVENTNNSYGAISDIKLKENIVDANSQWSDIKALQVRKYNFKEGQTHTQLGLIAQEVELVSPGLVSESPDRDEDGNDLGTVTKSVNYSVLYMKAVKALQEAMERIETLEVKVAALEAS